MVRRQRGTKCDLADFQDTRFCHECSDSGPCCLDELDQIIDRLNGRLLIQRARLRLSTAAQSGREDDDRVIRNIQTALHKMRALRDAMMVDQAPTKYLH